MERQFVILEVRETTNQEYGRGEQCKRYVPVDGDLATECMWLHPYRIIPASRLRYGKPDKSTVFQPHCGWTDGVICVGEYRLILDPPEEKDEWKTWIEECPIHTADPNPRRIFIDWLKRMPRRGK